MRFMSLWMPAKTSNANTPEMQAKMGKLIADMGGVMVMTGGWDPTGPSITLVAKDGKVRTIDGPYAEAKEMIGGFAIMECADEAEFVAWSKKFLEIAGDGVCNARPVYGTEQFKK